MLTGTCSTTDHPRSRGEYGLDAGLAVGDIGSSPLSRGIRRPVERQGASVRIIPALAGNTKPTLPRTERQEDHPRSRGEYEQRRHRHQQWPGSSPLSRGIQGRPKECPDMKRIIPALAGNTLVDKGFYQPDLSDLGNPLLARLRFSKSLAPRLRRLPSWRGESSGSSPEGPGRTIRVSPS